MSEFILIYRDIWLFTRLWVNSSGILRDLIVEFIFFSSKIVFLDLESIRFSWRDCNIVKLLVNLIQSSWSRHIISIIWIRSESSLIFYHANVAVLFLDWMLILGWILLVKLVYWLLLMSLNLILYLLVQIRSLLSGIWST